MRTRYHHTFGRQEQCEIYHFDAELTDVADHEVDDALNQGWLMTLRDDKPRWYQSRSTRCNLALGQGHIMPEYQWKLLSNDLPLAEMDHIYTAYCFQKKYKKYFEVNQRLPQDLFMGYYHSGSLVAWSKLRKYSLDSIETVLFVWDYGAPNLRLGEVTLLHELAWAQQQGYARVYMGPGYERSNLYKSRVPGFEWWTGSEWSHDTDWYRRLCLRDSKISQINQLHQLQIDRC